MSHNSRLGSLLCIETKQATWQLEAKGGLVWCSWCQKPSFWRPERIEWQLCPSFMDQLTKAWQNSNNGVSGSFDLLLETLKLFQKCQVASNNERRWHLFVAGSMYSWNAPKCWTLTRADGLCEHLKSLLVLLVDVGDPPGIVHVKTHPLHLVFESRRHVLS